MLYRDLDTPALLIDKERLDTAEEFSRYAGLCQ